MNQKLNKLSLENAVTHTCVDSKVSNIVNCFIFVSINFCQIAKKYNLVSTVKHFLFARTLFSRKFARPVTRENKVHVNISRVSIIVQEMNNRENKVS